MAGKKFSLIALLIFSSITFLNYQHVNSYNVASYNDNEPGLQLFNTLFYIDGTLVIYMVKPINKTCLEPKFYVRVIHANGAIETSTQTYPIPEFNFCYAINEDKIIVRIHKLSPKYAVIVYMNSTDVNSSATYGNLLSKNGEFINKFYIEKSPSLNGKLYNTFIFRESGDFNGGFLMFNRKTDSNDFQWIYFSLLNENGEIINLKSGIIAQAPIEYGDTLKSASIFTALNGRFGVVIANTTVIENDNSTKNIEPNQPSLSMYVTLIYKDETVGPFLIYQTTYIDLVFAYQICGTGFANSVYNCVLGLFKSGIPKIYWTKISFSLNGETYSAKYITYGYLLDNELKLKSTIDLPNNLTVSSFAQGSNHGTFIQNNTFIAIIPNENDNKNWQFITTEVPKLLPDDKGYINPNIESTYPPINGIIKLASEEINITYNLPIVPTVNNISIYQINNNDQDIFRQSFSANSEYCKISDDKKSLTIQVLTSTFNLPNTSYYVIVDNGALIKFSTDQPLTGILENVWKFTTDNPEIQYSDSVNGNLRLNSKGTNLFNSLDSTNKLNFIKNLTIGLANTIPIDPIHLNFIKDQMDYTVSPFTLLLSFKILKSNNNEEDLQKINAAQILNNLNILIKNKFITGISKNNHTSFIDENHGFIFSRNLYDLLEEFKIVNNGKNIPQLFIPSIIILILSVTFNSISSIFIVIKEISNNQEFYEWFKKYVNILAIFTVISSTEVDTLLILSSKMAGLKPFSAPFSSNSLSLIFWCSLTNFFIEDIPQFIIQVGHLNYN
ncbi:5780_t:CDS:10 [Entrophospora sp. SA101]|nr:5780_t:CDS:10 [Entrophospora sp. SA101]